MTNDQKADLIFVHVLATKYQESLDNIELNKQINKHLLKSAIKNLQRELEKVIKVLYTDIEEEEEKQLRDLTLAIDQGLEEFKKSLKNEYD